MPGMDGYEATRRIKASEEGQATTIIALTASAFEEDRSKVLDAGCDDFVRKPFRREQLFAKMSEHMDVRFDYTERPEVDDAQALTAETLAVLPAAWRRQVYEAADIDGAGRWAKVRHITIPQLTPTFFLLIVLNVIGSFQVFTDAFIVTNGGPAGATLVYLLHLYRKAFRSFHMGYGAAMGWFLFLIVLSLTMLQLWFSRRWVYYEAAMPGEKTAKR